jgi:hypothetical protein
VFPAIRRFFSRLLTGAVFGTCGGVVLAMSLYSLRYRPLWCAASAACLLAVCSRGLRRLAADRNWFGFGGRAVLLVASGFAGIGLVVFLFGLFGEFDRLDTALFIVSWAGSFIFVFGFNLLSEFGRDTALYREGEKFMDGLYVLGVLSGGKK